MILNLTKKESEVLDNIWEQVQEEFPFLPVKEQEQLAKQMFEDRCQ